MNEATLKQDYSRFVNDLKEFSREYAKKHHVSLAKSMDHITAKLNDYTC